MPVIKRSRNLALSASALALIVLCAWAWYETYGSGSAQTLAQRFVAECAHVKKDHAACYESLVPVLYPRYSAAEIFDVVREIRRNDASYRFCHVLAHKVGERVVAEDPSLWVEAIPLNPMDGLCSNGFIHGVIGGRFRAEVLDAQTMEALIPDFSRACEQRGEWAPSGLDRAICYHGMGHLYDFITNADLPKALELCAWTVPPDFQRVCAEGVFMQIYQPLEPDDFQLIAQMKIKLDNNTIRPFCTSFNNPEYVGACLRESWPFFVEAIRRGDGVEAFCSGHPSAEMTDHCYRAAFTIIGRLSLGDQDRAIGACEKSPLSWQEMCYAVLAQSALEEDREGAAGALALCARAPGEMAGACVSWLASQARFIYGSNTKMYTGFCMALPNTFRDICLEK